jgi:hypothetical protein
LSAVVLNKTGSSKCVSEHPKTYFFDRPPDRATSSALQAPSSDPLAVREAIADNLRSAHGRVRLNLPPTPAVAQLPDCRFGNNLGVHFND